MTTQEQVKDVVSQVLADKADKGGIKRVVWIGAGGSNGGNYPAQYFMEHEATQVVSSSYTSNEFVHATPAYVNENTLAVVVSMRGTKETIVAAQVAKDHGASTIAIYVDESGLTEVCDYKIQYDSLAVDESCMGRTNSAVVTMIAMELTRSRPRAMPSMRPLWPPSTWLTPSIARPSSTPVRSPPSGPSKTPTSPAST